jgi:hypothetical protein
MAVLAHTVLSGESSKFLEKSRGSWPVCEFADAQTRMEHVSAFFKKPHKTAHFSGRSAQFEETAYS